MVVGDCAVSELSLADRVNRLSDQFIQMCYHCHKCTAGCPAAFAMEYGPDRILRLLQLGQREQVLASRDIWLCLGCEMCGVHCPNQIDVGAVMIALRQVAGDCGYRLEDCEQLRETLAERLKEAPSSRPFRARGGEVEVDDRLCVGVQRLNRLSQTITTARNISGDDNVSRLIWSQNLERVPTGLARRRGAEIVYFVGCVGAFFPRSYRVPQAFTRILEMAEVDFTTMGDGEWCCGYPLLALGQIEQAEVLIRHNIDQLMALGASRLVSTCPSCYHMWKFVYPEIVGEDIDIEIVHATELLAELIEQGDVEVGALPLQVTYHDPCDLGRKSHVYEAPRQVLRSIPDLAFVEMSSCGQISECCGGGGNLESFDPEVVSEVSLRRIDRACEVNAQAIVSACQQCERTLTAAVRHHEVARRVRMRVMDVTELVWLAVQEKAETAS
jgi:heterodisulfide reductase subunit D